MVVRRQPAAFLRGRLSRHIVHMPIRILHLEDDPADAELVQATLLAEGLAVITQVVLTREDYQAALQPGRLDLILADFSLPRFDGLTALALAKQTVPDVP